MTPGYAMFTYLLCGLDYAKQNESAKAIGYYAESATLDVKFAIKDNASMQELALLLYRTGDIDNAYRCTQSAIEDALFSDSKFRTLHISEFYAIINTAYFGRRSGSKTKRPASFLIYYFNQYTFPFSWLWVAVYVLQANETGVANKKSIELHNRATK